MRNIWIWIVILIIIVGGGYWWYTTQAVSDDGTSIMQDAMDDASGGDSANAVPAAPASPTTQQTDTGASAAMTATVTYDGATFSPATVTIKQGGTVTFTDTSGTMWVASDPHPVHTGYDGTSRSEHCASGYSGPTPFDQCSPGSTYGFTFNKAGNWGYHDHINHSAIGTVVVQ